VKRAGHAFLLAVAAIGVPLAVALVFPHPYSRPIVPIGVSLVLAVSLGALGHAWAAVLTAVSATVAGWYFMFPPGETFRLEEPADAGALVAILAIGVVASLAVATLSRRLATVRSAQAISSERIASDRALLAAVQRAILPARPPLVEGADIVTGYRMAGSSASRLGGDFYVLVPYPNGAVGLGIGDVAGHGAAAVAHMAEARMTLRAMAALAPDPGVALQRAYYALRRTSFVYYMTLLYGVLDPLRHEWAHANAGHPPPILLHRDGRTSVLEGPGAGVLYEGRAIEDFPVQRVAVEPGDTVVLYTDGLVERRGRSIDEGIDRVRLHLATLADADARAVVNTLMSAAPDEPEDDIAVVAVKFTHAVSCDRRARHRPSACFTPRTQVVAARRADIGEVVQTPSGLRSAPEQHWVVTSNSGQSYLIPEDALTALFEVSRAEQSKP
jgi:serine phosphatase RsbU (regulator of sigma subunit)